MFKIEIIGYIGADARTMSNNGNDFVSFNVAHSEKYNDKEITTWVSVTTPNTKLAQYLIKGTKVFVRGNATLRTYQNDQHQTMAGINLFATEIEFCGTNNKNNATPEQPTQHEQPSPEQKGLPF